MGVFVEPIKVISHEEAVAANERFKFFRRGFIKAVRVVSGNAFLSDSQWAQQETLLASAEVVPPDPADLYTLNTLSVELELHHYHYGEHQQPRNRAVFVRADEASLSEYVLDSIGQDVFELVFDKTSAGIACILTSHAPGAGSKRNMANGRTVVLFTAPAVELSEAEWGGPQVARG